MSLELAALAKAHGKKTTRAQLLALAPPVEYNDGRTKQSYADETNIVKIMARAEKAGTISHLQKFEGIYADFSDFDFHEQTTKLTHGREVFDELPAEIRKEFGQSPQAFFNFVNDPANKDKLAEKLPHLAKPGRQMTKVVPPTADEAKAASAAASELASDNKPSDVKPAEPASPPSADA